MPPPWTDLYFGAVSDSPNIEIAGGVTRSIADPLDGLNGDFEMLREELGYGRQRDVGYGDAALFYWFAERDSPFTTRWLRVANLWLTGE
jgi:hypothetical protein